MHLIFIRHGDPDYKLDSVTEKGRRELELLSDRISRLNATEFFVSPMGRAQVTAQACLEKLSNVPSTTVPWLREFSYDVVDPKTGNKRLAWDLMPHELWSEKKYRDINKFHQSKLLKTGNIEAHYKDVCDGIDGILESYDYTRTSKDIPIYNCFPHLSAEEAKIDTHLNQTQKDLDEKNLVFVCHFGVEVAVISHLIGISPELLWHGFYASPSSVTIVGTEERNPGEVVFRIQTFGDITHLVGNGENVSASGYFGNCLSI